MKPRYFICGPRYIGGWETSKVIYLKVDSNGTKVYFSNKTSPTNQSFWSIGECDKVDCSGKIKGMYSGGQYVNLNITLQQILESPYFREVEVEELALII